MRKIITTTFITLDGVMQAPGGPTEDTSNGQNRIIIKLYESKM